MADEIELDADPFEVLQLSLDDDIVAPILQPLPPPPPRENNPPPERVHPPPPPPVQAVNPLPPARPLMAHHPPSNDLPPTYNATVEDYEANFLFRRFGRALSPVEWDIWESMRLAGYYTDPYAVWSSAYPPNAPRKREFVTPLINFLERNLNLPLAIALARDQGIDIRLNKDIQNPCLSGRYLVRHILCFVLFILFLFCVGRKINMKINNLPFFSAYSSVSTRTRNCYPIWNI